MIPGPAGSRTRTIVQRRGPLPLPQEPPILGSIPRYDYSSRCMAGSPCAYLEPFPSQKGRKLVQLQENCRIGAKNLAVTARSAERFPQTVEFHRALSQDAPLAGRLVGREVDDRRRRAGELTAVEL